MSVELALAIVATVDLAFKYGVLLVDACKTFREADQQVSALIIRIESSWLRTRTQLEIVEKVAYFMQEDHQRNQKEILGRLNETLKITVEQLETVVEKDKSRNFQDAVGEHVVLKVKSFKYVFKKEKLEKLVEDLETWQRLFDPSWYLLMTIANPIIDKKLEDAGATGSLPSATALRSARDPDSSPSGVFRSSQGIDQDSIVGIPGSLALIGRRINSDEWFILDRTACPQDSPTVIANHTRSIRDLAKKLMNADPYEFGLLRSKGVIKRADPTTNITSEFIFIFQIPAGCTEPCGLRSLLSQSNHYHSLSDRLDIAKDLARSVNYIHLFGYVHKNIRSENILILRNGNSHIGSAFLVGFEEIRTAEAASQKIGDSILERDVYRHPDRQGPKPRESYIMQHDIYSLGVCLLEIGLWVSLADTFTTSGINTSNNTPEQRLFVKNQLLGETRTNLPRRMGTKYAKIVETCLTCLDEGNEDFGDETVLQDEDGVLVSVRYIEKVLEKLELLNM